MAARTPGETWWLLPMSVPSMSRKRARIRAPAGNRSVILSLYRQTGRNTAGGRLFQPGGQRRSLGAQVGQIVRFDLGMDFVEKQLRGGVISQREQRFGAA